MNRLSIRLFRSVAKQPDVFIYTVVVKIVDVLMQVFGNRVKRKCNYSNLIILTVLK